MRFARYFLLSLSVSLILSCAKSAAPRERVRLSELSTPVMLGSQEPAGDRSTFLVTTAQHLEPAQDAATDEGEEALRRLFSGLFGLPLDESALPQKPVRHNSLILGFPTELLGQSYVFGGVITSTTSPDPSMGRLKLSDLSPLHVRPEVVRTGSGQYEFGLLGCAANCSEGKEEVILHKIPIVGTDLAEKKVFIDIGALGDELNLIRVLDPTGLTYGMRSVRSEVVSFEYSLSTLVMDVKVSMLPFFGSPSNLTVDFNVRWFLKLSSSFNSGFEPRAPTEGVGFFQTKRSASPKIIRFAIPSSYSSAPRSIHYYVKGVPAEYRPAFSDAFEAWNREFEKIIGRGVLTHEFLDEQDPRFATIVAGDIRYNVVEWDSINRTYYFGLGSPIANQYTGEIFSSNILIQGPAILAKHRSWFDASMIAKRLEKDGKLAAAKKVLRRANPSDPSASSQDSLALTLGSSLDFRIPSQIPSLEDPLPNQFWEPAPEGADFSSYMEGYFREIVAHELGHNLGLRHNFKGSLGYRSLEVGQVSNSIMEYLNRNHTFLNRIGDYDRMAIAYGYTGKTPADRSLYCTDEDVPSFGSRGLSPECSKNDVTDDPFSYFVDQISRAVQLANAPTSPGDTTSPVDLFSFEIDDAIAGILFYATSAKSSAARWTHFFEKPGRPTSSKDVPEYVIRTLREGLCAPSPSAESANARRALHERAENIARRLGISPNLLYCVTLPSQPFAE